MGHRFVGPRSLFAASTDRDRRGMHDTDTSSVDRLGLEVLTPDECWEFLAAAPVGRVAFVVDGEPAVFPVTHGIVGRTILFRSAAGSKVEAAAMGAPLAFEVDWWDVARHEGWSVLVRGVGETVYDDEQIERLSPAGVHPWLDAAADGTWIRIRVNEVSGRRLRG